MTSGSDVAITSDDSRHWTDRERAYAILESQPIAFIGVVSMFVACGATVTDVLLRWLANSGITGLNEIVAMAFAVSITACIPAGLATGVGITVDLLEKYLSLRIAVYLKLVGAIGLILMIALLAWRMGEQAAALQAESRVTVILQVPRAPFIWTACLLLILSFAIQCVVVADQSRRALLIRERINWRAIDIAAVIATFAIFAGLLALYFRWDAFAIWSQDHPVTTVIFAFALMWILLMLLQPLAAVLSLTGVIGASLLLSSNASLSAFATEAEGFLSNYQVATLPMFLLMGSFAAVSGVADDIYRLAQCLLGRFRGGLAMATIGGSAGFGAVTGSSLATVATFGRVALPQMESRRYSPPFAAGCVAAGGTLGALIPPSGPLIIFALLTEASIGQLFVAAIIPGLIAVTLYIVTIFISVNVRPSIAPAGEKASLRELSSSLRRCGAVAILFGVVIGGMYSGVFTVTEAAAVGAIGACALAIARRRLGFDRFWDVMRETTASTALIYCLIFGVLIFSFFVAASALPERSTAFVSSLQLPSILILSMILFCYLCLGCIMDSFSVMIITVPIITPIIASMGYDILWWGIINLIIVEIGLITPPFGLHLFILKSMLPNVSLLRIYLGVLPFCIADFLKMAILVAFPVLVLWLPSTMVK